MKTLFTRLWDRFLNPHSITRRIRNSYFVIIVLMIIPVTINILFATEQSRRYDRIITNVSNAGQISTIVSQTIPDEIFEIIAGNKTFEEGSQYQIIGRIRAQIETLERDAPNATNNKLLVVAGRAMNRLESYVDTLGRQILSGEMVEVQEQTLEEIRSITVLITDLLQEYILLEIQVASETNQMIQSAAVMTTSIELALTGLVCVFAVITRFAVSRSISKSILQLEQLASRIAKGDLDARVKTTSVEELVPLTDNLNVMAIKLQALMLDNRREQENLKKSEMRALQAQITPHFLYNTLDAIMWMAESGRNEEVMQITKAMSRFFRIVLSRGRDWIPVSQEIEHVQSYLTVQHARYREILSYSFDIDERLGEQFMLKLVLQPLVENAIYHGIKLRRSRGHIAVSGRLSGDEMHFSVSDDGIGMRIERLEQVRACLGGDIPETDDGYGLYNVDKRLRLYYGMDAGLHIESAYEKGTVVSFSVPVRSSDI